VDQEIPKFGLERNPALLGLPAGRLQRDHDVAKAASTERDILTIQEREGQHVGRPPRSAEAPGQLGDLIVRGESDRKLLVKEAQGV